MNEREPGCTPDSNKCGRCLQLAKVAFSEVFSRAYPTASPEHIGVIAENSKLAALVAENGPVVVLPCEERQELAKKIGRSHATMYVTKAAHNREQ